MKSYEKEAVDAAVSWNDDGFNKRDKHICTSLLNYPHIRLWKNKFSIFKNKQDFLDGFDKQTENLKKEGWDHTVTLEIKVVQSDESKVHLLLHQSRRNSDDVEYHNFHTLWIMTNIEGKWGIQFRSSFLDKSSQTKNII